MKKQHQRSCSLPQEQAQQGLPVDGCYPEGWYRQVRGTLVLPL
jgi:hypothetical protein